MDDLLDAPDPDYEILPLDSKMEDPWSSQDAWDSGLLTTPETEGAFKPLDEDSSWVEFCQLQD